MSAAPVVRYETNSNKMPSRTTCWFHHLDYTNALVLLLSALSADVQTEWYKIFMISILQL